ncbi:hypothetical protein [Piscinibacter gummiphilus]|uniref:Uncharacterized protein n=1 Tax=Piscinibacter gummiphilus TaxID=946333 RepID=A0A1W6LE46_9BURK|nr:hypothetical protein [Piscinibacter gummiphilus]ARN22534.1 hypothetical protein A4W93_22930 [Piscinibacter gummiphilus]ATU67230.1 hypothetical protein CPZ87_23060 [Piscinibacter gummiphilus]GLS98122.1 hypothetical protein GCM10007918_54140 [Piscinibacter gummiphilus]
MDLHTRPRRCHLVLVAAAALAGIRPASAADTELQQRAAFYSQYAALAADVYITGGRVDKLVPMALASPWLRRQIKESQDAGAAERYEALAVTARQAQRDERADEMPAFATRAGTPAAPARPSSSASEPAPLMSLATPGTYEAPRNPEDCNREDAPIALVPLKTRSGWERIPELHRETSARGWSMFVPDLAMDVWRRARAPEGGRAVIEYAIVYRGTDGAGGWFSNMRGLFANTPMVWDQYRQARDVTSDTLLLIDKLHALTDNIFGRTADGTGTKLLITTVGHSLGAGIARYIYLRDKRVTRVVGFNPSPIDGSSQILVDDRDQVDVGRATIDGDARAPGAAMFMLYEHGEVLNVVSGGCPTGPVWGDGGGPHMHCESVNLSHGNWVRQHGMRQLACKLQIAAWGIAPAPATTAARAP